MSLPQRQRAWQTGVVSLADADFTGPAAAPVGGASDAPAQRGHDSAAAAAAAGPGA